MTAKSASSSLTVYASDALLLVCTLASLTFRAWRQAADPSVPSDHERRGRRAERSSGVSTPQPVAPLQHPRTPCKPLWSISAKRSKSQRGEAVALHSSFHENIEVGSDDSTDDDDDAEALAASGRMTDPLLILYERLTLEEKLSTAVNWLSLVSNCLTYFLRPSQVLYTFLFTNGDFILFVTTYSRRYQHLHAPTPPPTTRRSHAQSPEEPAALTSMRCAAADRCGSNGAPAAGAERRVGASSSRGATLLQSAERGGTVDSQERDASACGAAVAVPLPFRHSLVAAVLSVPRHRDGAPHRTPRRAASLSASDLAVRHDAPPHSPRSVERLAFFLRGCVRRSAAFARTQLSWLLLLNALFTSTLFVFHLHHLFFFLGDLFGYLAAIASLYLCGMELACVVVRVGQRRRSGGALEGVGDQTAEAEGADELATVIDTSVDGPAWAFLGEHLSASACSMLYVWMLVGEGAVLWSTHVNLMRWYVCSCALLTLSLLKCARVLLPRRDSR